MSFLCRLNILLYIFQILQDVLTFGRPGYGAPVRTNSGHLRTSVLGNPEIRFQDDKSVQKAIINNIRYSANRDDKAHYQKELGNYVHISALDARW